MSVLKKEPLIRIKPFSDVFISEGNGVLKNILKRGFDALGGIDKFIKPGQSVILKPNLTAGADPITGGTTDVRFVEAIVELIKEYCKPGYIACGENTSSGSFTQRTFKRLGYDAMCERQGIGLVDFTNAERVDVPVPGAMYAEVVSLPKILVEADVFITLPVLKNHDTVSVTAALKNGFGHVTGDTRRKAHRDDAIEQYIVDIARARKPDFAIVDGRIGMEGIAGGDRFNHPRYANRIVMGADPVAVDTVCAHIMEQNPRVRHLQWADANGLGNCNLDYINIRGMPLSKARIPFMAPAGEIEEDTDGKIHLTDLGSCSLCRAVAQGTLHRFSSPESIIKNVEIVYGPGDWTPISRDSNHNKCLFVGNCIQEKYRKMGTWVPGCPVNRDDYFSALSTMDIVCTICEQTVKRFVAGRNVDDLAFIRILAANKSVFKGADNKAGPTDFLLTFGDCQQGYFEYHVMRTGNELKQLGIADNITPEFFALHIPGHSPSIEQLESALAELKQRHDSWIALLPTLGKNAIDGVF